MTDRRPGDDPSRILDESRAFDVEQRLAVNRALADLWLLARKQVQRAADTAMRINATERDETALLADLNAARMINRAIAILQQDDFRLLLTEAERANI